MLSSGTGRLIPPKITFACSCGKRYKVPATKAGKRVRCKGCRLKITVPSDGQISMRTRKAILSELGIDPDAAKHAYEEQKRLDGYVCGMCSKRIPEADLKAAYMKGGLACEDCRAAQVVQREFGDPVENERKKRAKEKKLDRWSGKNADEAGMKAKGLGALFFFGLLGFLTTVVSLAWWLAAPIALAVAFAGARTYFKNVYIPEDEEQSEKG